MIFSFTGNNNYLLRQEILRWKKAFAEKHGEENVFHFRLSEHIKEEDMLGALLSPSLFNPKTLVIIDDLFEKRTIDSQLARKIIEAIPRIGDDTILVINAGEADKRSSIYKHISKLSEIKDFSMQGEYDAAQKLSTQYSSHITSDDVLYLLQKKAGNYEKSLGEIEKLRISREKITRKDIDDFVMSEYDESIFECIDLLLQKSPRVFEKITHICESGSVFSLYYSIMANLRVTMYIMNMKAAKFSKSEISQSLKVGKREFLIDKRYKSKSSEVSKLFEDLTKIDSSMKQGKLLFSDEEYICSEIEKAIMRLIQ